MTSQPSFKDRISNATTNVKALFSSSFAGEQATVSGNGVIKAFVSNEFLYKPPYGYPRMVDIPTIRLLAQTPYVFSVITTILDQVASMEWDVVPKEKDEPDANIETLDDQRKETDRKESAQMGRIKEVKAFFNNPNDNHESFEFLIRAAGRDILEIDSGVFVKVFGLDGKLKQIFARDGGTFLKNPDIHGYMGHRDDYVYVPQRVREFGELARTPAEAPKETNEKYSTIYSTNAAYFQYGWTAMMPIPFGRREIVYMMRNPRTDSVYGRSPIEILNDIILTLFYGAKYNLEIYSNNNMPEGILELIGANAPQLEAFRERMEKTFRVKDSFGNFRKAFHKIPIVNNPTNFTPFQLPPKEMEIISQQQWFHKIVMACFGVTPSEMGFTEDSNRATDISQSKVFKRKAVKPLLRLLEYSINMQIMPELDPSGELEFRFIEYDMLEDIEKHKLYEIQLKNGIRNVNEVRDEMGLKPREGGDDYAGGQQSAMDDGFGYFGDEQEPPEEQGEKEQEERPEKAGKNDEEEKPEQKGGPGSGPQKGQGKKEELTDTRSPSDVLFNVMSAKKIKLEPIYKEKMKDKYSGRNITVDVRPATIDGHKMWIASRGKQAVLFIRKPTAGTELSAADFSSKVKDAAGRMERRNNALKIEGKALTTTPPLTPKENEKVTKKKVKSSITDILRMQELLVLQELEKIFTSNKLAEVKNFQDLWQRLLKKLPAILSMSHIEEFIERFVKDAYNKGGDEATKEFAQNFFPNKEAIEFVKNYNFDLIKNMNVEMENKLGTTLQRGFMDDQPFADMKKEVQKIFKTTEARAEAIVRTEQNRAQNFGRLDGAKQSTLKKGKSILVVSDEDTSPICRRMRDEYSDKVIGLDEKFVDPNPDPKQAQTTWTAPPFHVNCRTRIKTPRIKEGSQ